MGPTSLLDNQNFTLREEAAAQLEQLKAARWIDRDTRALFVDFNLFNANMNIFQVNRLAIEMPISGGVRPHSFVRAVKLYRYETLFEKVILGFEVIFVFMVLYYLGQELQKMWHEGLCTYFIVGIRRDMWRILDIINLTFFVIVIYSRIFTLVRMQQVNADPNNLEYVDMQFVARIVFQEKNFNAFNGMLCWLKSLKYLSIQARIAMYTWTLSDAKRDASLTLITLLIMYMGFTCGFYLIFNTDLYEYRTFLTTFYYLVCMMFGDFDFIAMYRINSTAVILFLLFMVLMFLTVVNIFIAIINGSYDKGMEKASDPNDGFRDIFGVLLTKLVAKLSALAG